MIVDSAALPMCVSTCVGGAADGNGGRELGELREVLSCGGVTYRYQSEHPRMIPPWPHDYSRAT